MNEKNKLNDPIIVPSEIELDGVFEYHEKKFFCQGKLAPLYFFLTKNKLFFFKEKNKKNLLLSIKRDHVLAIRKVHKHFQDIFKFSIFYLEENNLNEISEIKLKSKNPKETDRWIKILREKINPKNFFDSDFFNNKNIDIKISDNYVGGDLLFPFKDESEKYLKICHLEYIILIRKMKEFFYFYRKNCNKNIDSPFSINNVNDEDISGNNEEEIIRKSKTTLVKKKCDIINEDSNVVEGDCGLIIGEKNKE